ncbi:MAG: hypothetical protein Ta2E_12170 [Mycoplasmoidaceae bacterium]|nr:MAG: hypothetical protein Ta2E_12170 [Mycoplasmoidaceae bacterium]
MFIGNNHSPRKVGLLGFKPHKTLAREGWSLKASAWKKIFSIGSSLSRDNSWINIFHFSDIISGEETKDLESSWTLNPRCENSIRISGWIIESKSKE